MSKLSKEKRDQLILAGMITAGVLAGLWFGVISFQNQALRTLANNKAGAVQELQGMKDTIRNANEFAKKLKEASEKLAEQEHTMASGDYYSWMTETIRTFELGHKVEIPSLSQLEGPKDFNMLPRFPYQQASVTLLGKAHFHDLGKFIADLENQFPLMRVQNLDISPLTGVQAGDEPADKEKLEFKMDLVALVKPAGQ